MPRLIRRSLATGTNTTPRRRAFRRPHLHTFFVQYHRRVAVHFRRFTEGEWRQESDPRFETERSWPGSYRDRDVRPGDYIAFTLKARSGSLMASLHVRVVPYQGQTAGPMFGTRPLAVIRLEPLGAVGRLGLPDARRHEPAGQP